MLPNSQSYLNAQTNLCLALDETVRRNSNSPVLRMLKPKPILDYKAEAIYQHYEALERRFNEM